MDATPILMYHRVADGAERRWPMVVPLVDFAAQMAFLARREITVLTLADFVQSHRARRRPRSPAVVLTFDDGYAATCDRVEAILERYGYAATLFLTTGLVGQTDPLGSSGEGALTWARVRRLRRLHVEAHTVSHPRLSRLSPADVRREVRGCKGAIEHELGRTIDHFAYPSGAYTSSVREEVRAAGYASAGTVRRGPAGPGDDPFRLHRITVDGRDPPEIFRRKVRTGFGSPRERLTTGVRDGLVRLPGLHDLVERWTAGRL